MKTCGKCKTEKDQEDFCRNRAERDGKSRWCKACLRVSTERWRQANPDKCRQYLRTSARRRQESRSEKWVRDSKRWKEAYRVKNTEALTDQYLLMLLANQGISRAAAKLSPDLLTAMRAHVTLLRELRIQR